jgi:hypothetical protein
MFTVVQCKNELVDIRVWGNREEQPQSESESINEQTAGFISREAIGLVIVGIDFIMLVYFLMAIWFLQHYVGVEKNKQKKKLLEVREFCLLFSNLPELTNQYSQEMLKAELWAHITSAIKEHPQQIEEMKDMDMTHAE